VYVEEIAPKKPRDPSDFNGMKPSDEYLGSTCSLTVHLRECG
jgi:hypothetical protein